MAQAELDQATYNLTNKAEAEQNDLQTLLNTFSEGTESQQDLNFSMDDNDVDFKKEIKNQKQQAKKRNTLYSSTKSKGEKFIDKRGV